MPKKSKKSEIKTEATVATASSDSQPKNSSEPVVVQVTETAVSPGKSRLTFAVQKKTFVYLGVVAVVAVVAASAFYYHQQYKAAQKILSSNARLTPRETEQLVDKIGKLMILPTDEIPMIATIANKDQLMKSDNVNAAFFSKAADGDKVLVYKKAGQAIIYRPSTNQLVEVGPVNIQQKQPSQSVAGIETSASDASSSARTEQGTPTPSPAFLTVTILNGTKTAGLAKKAESELKSNQLKIENVGNAVNDQEKTIVVDTTGKQASAAKTIADRLHGTVASSLPQGEAEAHSDILIILGQDYVK
jgi:hypothetical protein